MATGQPAFTLLGLPLIVVALTLAALQAAALRTITLGEGDGQVFADAIAEYGGTGEDTMLLLPQGRVLSLLNITVREAQPGPGYTPFSSGTLTMMPGPGNRTTPTVLDAAMVSNLARYNGTVATFLGMARLVVKGLTIVNNCDWYHPLVPHTSLGFNTAVIPSFLKPPAFMQGFTFTDVVYYIRQADLTQWGVGESLLSSPFHDLASLLNVENSEVQIPVAARMLTAFAVTLDTLWLPSVVCNNITLASVVNPGDPLLQQLAAANRLMPPQLCQGTPLGTGNPPMVSNLAPMWLTSDAVSLTDALTQATTNVYWGATLGGPLTVVLTGTALVGALQAPPSLPALTNKLVLSGPLTRNYNPKYTVHGTLDCRGLVRPLLQVSQSGQLYLQYLRLVSLPTQPLPGSGLPSAFPLSLFQITNLSKPVQGDSITLELPTLDYLALAMLAQPALGTHVNTTVRDHAAALKAGIKTLNASVIAPSLLSIDFATVTGWGLHATNIRVQPDDPEIIVALAVSVAKAALSMPAPTSSTDSNSSSNHTRELWLIIGLAVVGTLAAATALVLAAWSVRHRRNAKRDSLEARNLTEVVSDGVNKVPNSPVGQQPWPLLHNSPSATSAHGSTHPPSNSTVLLDTGAGPCLSEQHQSQTSSPSSSPSHKDAGSHLSLQVKYTDGPEPRETGSWEQPGSDDASQSLVQMLSRTTEFASSTRQSRLTLRDVKQLEAFCGALAAVTATQVTPVGPDTGSEGHQVTLALGNGPTVECSAPASSLTATAPVWQQHPVMTAGSNHEMTQQSTPEPGSGSGTGPEAAITHNNSPLQRKTTSTSHTSAVPDPKTAVGQLMQELKGDMNTVEIDGVLGQGSWGTVYSGQWRGLEVALKTMMFEVHDWSESNPAGGQDARSHAHRQAVMEAAVAASVDHPNLVRTYYYDIQAVQAAQGKAHLGLQIDERATSKTQSQTYKLFLIQERCRTSLAHVLDARAFLDAHGCLVQPHVVLLLLLDIARGLEYLHGRNIVHGDLKPANVLLAATGSGSAVAKLADFGLSAQLTAGATHISNYRSGTPFYVAPEVVHEHRTSPASDIFSFGVMMWQLYSGQWPYLASPEGNFSWNPAFPHFRLPNMPPAVYIQLVHRCLTRDPKDRPLAAQIVAILEMLNVQTGQASAVHTTL